MRTLEFIVPSEYDGRKVLHYLRGSAGLSSRLIRNLKMFENGMMLNGVHTRTVDIIHTGDKITVNLPEDEVADTAADIYEMPTLCSTSESSDDSLCASFTFTSLADYGVEILYEDEDLIVVNKPATLAIHPSHNHQGDTLANLIAAYLKTKNRVSVFRAVGRLDKGTSGIVICALNAFAANKLQGNIRKTYYALPSGCYSGSGTVNAPIYRPDPIKTYRTVDDRGDYAVTHWTALKTGEEMSLVRVNLETGRTHQIRVHFAHLGTPLVGDTMYGEPDQRISHQSLHCGEAEFKHPYSGDDIVITANIPNDMQALIDTM